MAYARAVSDARRVRGSDDDSGAGKYGNGTVINNRPIDTTDAVMPPVVRDIPIISQVDPGAAVEYATGGGGGGGGGGAAIAAAAPRMSLEDYIKNNFLYTSAQNEGQRQVEDYDADTLRQKQDVTAEQGVRRGQLQRDLNDAGVASAESLAGRGLLRSGFTFQNQDRINAEGAEKENSIAQMLTDLLSQRQSGRQGLEANNRNTLNGTIAKLTDQFNANQAI